MLEHRRQQKIAVREDAIDPGPARRFARDLREDPVIRFVDRLEVGGDLRYVGTDAAFSDDAFFVVRGKHKAPVLVQVPFPDLGGHCELVCERGLAAVPLLVVIVNLTALARGALPLHASAFIQDGVGVLATGWAKGGKTETLLAFEAHGATYVGDEWVYLCDGRAAGVPEPMTLWAWQLQGLPDVRRRLPTGARRRLRALDAGSRLLQGRGRAGGAAARLGNLFAGQAYTHVPPHDLFGTDRVAMTSQVDVVLFVCSGAVEDIRVEPVTPHEIAARMLASLEHERARLAAYERAFRFAFPGSRCEALHRAAERERALLDTVLDGKPAYRVVHPYPLHIPALYDAIAPVLG